MLTHGSLDDLKRSKYELKSVTKKLVELSKRIGELDNQVDQLHEDDVKINTVLDQSVVSHLFCALSFLFNTIGV